jgi:hypothetical protein
MYHLHVLAAYMATVSMKILWMLLWEALRDKIILMGGSLQEMLLVRVAFPKFNPRVWPVGDAMEQDFLSRLPNSCVSEGDICAGPRNESVREDDIKAKIMQYVR